MLRMKCRAFLPPVVLVLALSACAHTKIINTWRDPEHERYPKKVLVHAMAMSPTVKDLFENMLVNRLKDRGVDAVASHGILPDSMELDKAAMKKVVGENGIDTILVGHLLDKKVVETLKPGHVTYGATVYFDPDGSFVMAAVGPAYVPGVDDDEQAIAEFVMFDVVARKRVWVVQTKTFVSNTRTEEVKPMVDLIMERLQADKMVP
jgi:hypothetical protein